MQMTPMPLLSRLWQTAPLSVALFVLWVILSGKFDVFHLSIGAASALWIALGTRRLLFLPPAIGVEGIYPLATVPWVRVLGYLPWLGWQIILSSLQVVYVVLHPKLPIQPRLIRFHTALPHALARLTLANSITLTPGTVTLDVEGDAFLVHALTASSAKALDPGVGDGDMQRRVAALYATQTPSQPTGSSR